MGSRERKRAERRKRKARSGPRETVKRADNAASSAAAAEPKGQIERGYAKAEQRNREAREVLEPLGEGERPRVVMVGAAFSALIALIFWASTGVALFTDATVDGREPNPLQLAAIAAVLTVMAWGMWTARYWAVLGFQMLLVLFLLAGIAGLLGASTVPQVIGTLVIVAICLTFFIFMVKAMARIQMPNRMPPR